MAFFTVAVKLSLCFLFGAAVHYIFIDLPTTHPVKTPGGNEPIASPKPNDIISGPIKFPISNEENTRECARVIKDFYVILESMSNMSSDGNLCIGAVYRNYMKIMDRVVSLEHFRLGFPTPYEVLPNNTLSGMKIANKLLNRLVVNGNYYRPVTKRKAVIDMSDAKFQILTEDGLHLFLMVNLRIRWMDVYGAVKFTESMVYMRCNQKGKLECKIKLISQRSISE